ncbi:MAG: beta-lactamase family protein [Bryobacterales bacterium]|nr:beta-lactamase family protein [Bryobacterales bacterium]
MRIRLLALPLLGCLLVAQTPPPKPVAARPAAGLMPQRVERLKAGLQEMVDKKEFAGITVMASRKGQTVLSAAVGFRDLEAKKPMTADTIFRIFSMTKPVTSVAAMILYEEGKFLMDDPVSKYIPEFANVRVLFREDGAQSDTAELKRPLTIHHLLTHTSGMVNSRGYAEKQVFRGVPNLEEMARRLATVPLSHQPGEAWRYGQGLDLVARLVEIWSGKRYDQFLKERIFVPLGMTDTGYFVPREKLDRVSKSYVLNKDGVMEAGPGGGDPSREPTYFQGGAGLYSTAGDYMKFLGMLVNGGVGNGKRVLSRSTVDFMFRNHVPLDVIPPGGPNGRGGHGFGIGGAVLVNPVESQVMQSEGNWEWGGAAGTYFWVDRKNDLAAVWMVQRPPFVPGPSKRFKVMLYSALE